MTHEKEPVFQPEYYSGLNYKDAEKLVGKFVAFSNINSKWMSSTLEKVRTEQDTIYRFVSKAGFASIYIRTTPETYTNPTITIGGFELPRPETEPPPEGTEYWVFCTGENKSKNYAFSWENDNCDKKWLKKGLIHLTEDRLKAWEDWWENTVVNQLNKEV